MPNNGVRPYVLVALICCGIGAAINAPAIALRVKQRTAWAQGFGEFDTDLFGPTMPIDTAVRWLNTFSVPFWVIAAFAIYRIVCKWSTVDNCSRTLASASSQSAGERMQPAVTPIASDLEPVNPYKPPAEQVDRRELNRKRQSNRPPTSR